jgi:ABC-type antimicrobial peptide transport system permease subunit
MQEMMANSLERRRFALTLMALFGALALFLASIGIYGVMAYAIGQRSQEFGIRMALGAEPRDILLLAFRPGVVLTGIGIAVGLLGGLGAARLMSSLLFGVAPHDPLTFGAVVCRTHIGGVGRVRDSRATGPTNSAEHSPSFLTARREHESLDRNTGAAEDGR